MVDLRYSEFGTVRCIRGCIVVITGFKNCINGQLIKFGYGTVGMIVGFDLEEAQVLIIKETEKIKTGDQAIASLEPFNTPVGNKFIGRIVNPLGETLDGLGPLEPDAMYPIFREAPPILNRAQLCKTLETGIKVLDAMIPIGFGQRQLILGDKMTGKTTFVTDTIINQKNTGVICIYCCIGKATSALSRVVQLFLDHDCFNYSLIVSATASSTPGQQYLSPYVACSIAEYFLHQGKDVFIGFDDFTKHAWCYREISLLLGRAPGRDSYPGDIFFLHSKMIERACFLNKENGGGSITFFPIVEILEGDLTGFVPSNLISMTDGQIYLSTQLFGEGHKPALDLGLSVSRVGSKVQWQAIKKLSGPLRLEYLQYRELQRISKLKTTGQSEEAIAKLKSGAVLTELLKQDRDHPVSQEAQVLVFYAFNKKILHNFTIPEVNTFQDEILDFARQRNPTFLRILRERKKLDEEIEKGLMDILTEYKKLVDERRTKMEEQVAPLEPDLKTDVLDAATSRRTK